jgi:hypothetical protein
MNSVNKKIQLLECDATYPDRYRGTYTLYSVFHRKVQILATRLAVLSLGGYGHVIPSIIPNSMKWPLYQFLSKFAFRFKASQVISVT